MSNEIMFGCDPEVFVREKATGKFVSAYGLIEGTKEKPFRVEDGAVQVDGMALEFNTDPTSDPAEFARRVKSVYKQLSEMIPDHLELVAVPTAEFGADYLKTQPKEALELGCDPDYNAYTGKQNPRPNGDVTFRTGAGHIHIGWTENANIQDKEHIEVCRLVIKQLDATLGVSSFNWDDDVKRRDLYGDKGAYRVKPYGVEYRTLSNAWLNHPELYKLIPKIVKNSWELLRNTYPETKKIPEELDIFKGKSYEEVKHCVLELPGLFPYKHLNYLRDLRNKVWSVEPKKEEVVETLPNDSYYIGERGDEALLDKLEELGIRWRAGQQPRDCMAEKGLALVFLHGKWHILEGFEEEGDDHLDIFRFKDFIPPYEGPKPIQPFSQGYFGGLRKGHLDDIGPFEPPKRFL